MAFSTKLKIIDAKMEQPSGSTLTLSGDTTVADSGDMRYATHPTFVDDEQIVDKKYVDDNIISGSDYDLSTPSTVTVGGLNAGSTLTGLSSNEILEDILVPYIAPTFSSFQISGQATTIEVGTALSGIKSFTWGTTQSGNVASNSIIIRDVTAASNIATGLANDGGEPVDIGTITNTSPISHSWRGQGTNTQAGSFNSSNFTVRSIYPYYYGKVVGAGASGDNRPVANQALVLSGTKVVVSSNNTISITYNSAADEYIWFAIPSTSTSKLGWYVTDLNKGNIGGSVSPGGNLFPDFDTVSVTTALWSSVNYKVYIANYQSAFVTVQMRNAAQL